MLIIFFFYGNTALDAFVSTKNSAFSVPRIVLRAFSVKKKTFPLFVIRGHSFSMYAKFSRKINISYSLRRTFQGVRNVSFTEKFCVRTK